MSNNELLSVSITVPKLALKDFCQRHFSLN